MGIHYEFQNDLVVFTYTGDFDMRTLLKTWGEAVADPAFKPVTKIIIDARRSKLNIPTDQMEFQAIIVTGTESLSTVKWAVVTGENTLAFGLSRMFQSFADLNGLEIEVFKDYDQTLDFLSSSSAFPSA